MTIKDYEGSGALRHLQPTSLWGCGYFDGKPGIYRRPTLCQAVRSELCLHHCMSNGKYHKLPFTNEEPGSEISNI